MRHGEESPRTDDAVEEAGAGTVRRDFLKRAAIAGAGATAAGGLLVGQATARGKPDSGAKPGRPPVRPPERGEPRRQHQQGALVHDQRLRPRSHDRVLRGDLPGHAGGGGQPPEQAYNGYNIRRGRFRARMMRDPQPFQGGGILLVQWLTPGPVGTPMDAANHVGWYREHADASRTGMQFRYEQALAAGGRADFARAVRTVAARGIDLVPGATMLEPAGAP